MTTIDLGPADTDAPPTIGDDIEQLEDDGTDGNVATEVPTSWTGVLVVEGVTTGDGREFADGALTWADPPIPLRWNKQDSHGGIPQTVTVNVGKIDNIWRDGNQIHGTGIFNMEEEDGRRAHQMVKDGFLSGISVDADDIADSDVELVWPETGASESDDEEDGPDIFDLLFGKPEKVIFHAGRVRAATLCDIPAFVEAKISLVTPEEAAAAAEGALAAGAVGTHSTVAVDETWDGPANELRLPATVPVATARRAYAWIGAVTDAEVAQADAQFIHHVVDVDGTPGAANLTACSSGIGVLNGGRGGTTIPGGDRRGVYEHLAGHLRAAGREPPPLNGSLEAMVAAGAVDLSTCPPREWFEDPRLSVPTPLVVLDDGRMYGHVATWGTCHIGHPDTCVTPPHEDAHPYFMTGELTCGDGSRVSVGQITLGTKHAALSLNPSAAAEHYEHTGVAVADVVVGNDVYGIWFAGAVRDTVAQERVRELRASGQLSGDWRRIGGSLRLIGLLAVNVPGFPVPRIASRVSAGQQLSLVAAGARSFDRGDVVEGEKLALRRIMQRLSNKVKE